MLALGRTLGSWAKRHKPTGLDYRLVHAFSSTRKLHWWLRYAAVANETLKGRHHSILEVGAEGESISGFLNKKLFICLLNIRKKPLASPRRNRPHPIVGDGCNLPFKKNSFDIVIALRTLEQIPRNMREGFLGELRRVGKKVILYTFVSSNNGLYQGNEYCLRYQKVRRRLGLSWFSPEEFLKSRAVMMDEITRVYPNAKYVGRTNCKIWLSHMTLSHTPFLWVLTGLIYYLIWKRKDNEPPYLEAMVILNS